MESSFRAEATPWSFGEGDRFRMWYGGFSAATGVIFDTWSDDGQSWSPSGWDEAHLTNFDGHGSLPDHYSPEVVMVGEQYWMFYTDYRRSPEGAREDIQSIRRVVSEDGINWGEESAVLEAGPVGSWDTKVSNPSVLVHDGVFLLWYSGSDSEGHTAIGRASSPDGLIWTRDAQGPVLGPGAPGAFDDLGVATPQVKRVGETFYLWYTGATGGGNGSAPILEQIGWATSTDGLRWDRQLRPLLQPLEDFESSHIGSPAALIDGSEVWLWYTAVNSRSEPTIARARCPLSP